MTLRKLNIEKHQSERAFKYIFEKCFQINYTITVSLSRIIHFSLGELVLSQFWHSNLRP